MRDSNRQFLTVYWDEKDFFWIQSCFGVGNGLGIAFGLKRLTLGVFSAQNVDQLGRESWPTVVGQLVKRLTFTFFFVFLLSFALHSFALLTCLLASIHTLLEWPSLAIFRSLPCLLALL